MASQSRIDKLIRHYKDPERNELTQELEEFQNRLDYCRDLLKRLQPGSVWRLLVRKFNYSRASAYNDIQDTKRFFSRDFDKADRPFETVMAIENLQKLYDRALSSAKTSRDFFHCAKIQEQISKHKGLFDQESSFDPRLLQPSVIQLVIPTLGRPKVIDALSIGANDTEVIDLVEGMNFSVENMESQIKKLKADESDGV